MVAGIVVAWSASRSARSERRSSARSAFAARLARSTASAIGSVAGGSASRIAAPVAGSSSSVATRSCRTAGARRGMSAPTTSAMAGPLSAMASSPVARPASGPPCAAGSRAIVIRPARSGGSGGTAASGARTRTISSTHCATRSRAWWTSGRPSKGVVDLVGAEAPGRAPGEDDPDGPRHGVSAVAATCARMRSSVFGPSTWPASVRRRMPAPVEVLEDHQDVAPARAGLVAERGGGERRLRGQLAARAG